MKLTKNQTLYLDFYRFSLSKLSVCSCRTEIILIYYKEKTLNR